jgi:flagella basal body P-ring formation protein FlgA
MRKFLPQLLASLSLLTVAAVAQADGFQSNSSIIGAVESFLEQHIDDKKKSRIDVGALDARLRLTPCNNELETFFLKGSRAFGRTTVGVRCTVPKPWTIYVPATVKIYGKVLATSHPVARGTRITKNDIKTLDYELALLSSGYYVDPNNIVGKIAKRPIPTGRVFRPALLDAPRLVQRGEEVTILAETKGLKVQMPGVALMDGSAQDKITIRNKASKKVIQGTVVAAGVVKVRM